MARDGKKGQVGWVTQIFIRFPRVFPSELSHDSHGLKALKGPQKLMMSQTIQARAVTDGSGVNGLKSDA